jgi:hypothetical protein
MGSFPKRCCASPADRGRPPVTAYVSIGGNHVHPFPRVLQWSPLRGDVGGWHRQRHHAGPHGSLRHDERRVGTSTWPKPGTPTWPPVGTFPWPRTVVGRFTSMILVGCCSGLVRRVPRALARYDAATSPDNPASRPLHTHPIRPDGPAGAGPSPAPRGWRMQRAGGQRDEDSHQWPIGEVRRPAA